MDVLGKFLVATPVFAIFICLALGYVLGKLKIGSFTLGATVGVLVVSLIIGQLGVFTRDTLLGDIFFDFFMFAIGYRVGPNFISSMKKFGAKIVYATFIFLISAFLVAWACFKIFNVGPGIAAGVIAGALTQSAVIGSSLETIAKLPISNHLKDVYSGQIPIVYALTYVFGTIGVLIFIRDIMPKMMHIELKKQAVKTAKELDMIPNPVIPAKIRFFKVLENSPLIGKKASESSSLIDDESVIAGINGKDISKDTIINKDDVISIIGGIESISKTTNNNNLFEIEPDNKDFVSKKVVLGKKFTIATLESASSNGMMIAKENGERLDLKELKNLKVSDTITILGFKNNVKSLINKVGKLHSSTIAINYAWFALGMALSAALGMVEAKVNGVPLALGGGTASLIVGLIMSIYQDKHAYMDSIPDDLLEFFQSIGLNLFIVTVGLSAAKTFTSAMHTMGISVLLIGVIVSIVPHFITFLIGYYLMKMEPISLIGAQTGADTLSAALNDISERVGSDAAPFFAAAVAPAYAIGNIFLTLMGPIFLVILSK